MTALAEIDADLRQPDLTVLDRALLLHQRSRAYHARTISPYELIEVVESRPDLTPLDRASLLRLYRSTRRMTLTSCGLETVLRTIDRKEKD